MASLDEERYLRHLWLLGEGGLFVLRGVVSREATHSHSPLDNLLQNGRARFKGLLKEQHHRLFPTPTTVNADIYTWDMSLLFVVLKKLFWSGLSLSKRASLSTLKTYRNDFQGHPTILSMNASDYSSNRQLLEQALRQLASGINGNVEIESIIKRTATGRIDSNSISKHIREIYDFKTSFLTAVEDMLKRVNLKFSSIQGNQELVLSKLTNMEIKNVWKTKHEFSRELKVIIQEECENEEKQKEANDLLFDFVKIIQSDITIESDKIRRIIAVRMEWYGEPTLQLLDDLIEWFSDIADMSNGIGTACLGSIVLPIFCSSVPDILALLKYMNGDQNKQHLSRIASTVREILGFPCSLSWKVKPTSLRSALSSSCQIESQPDKSTDDPLADKEHKRQIQKTFSSSDPDKKILSMTDVSEEQGISKGEEVYWVKSVLALKITADDAMTYLARSIFKKFYNSLNIYEKMNLEHLLDIAQNRHKGYKLTSVKDHRVWVVNSPECRSLLEKLVSAHWDPAYVEWDNIGDNNVERYWKIAKLYMPYGNKYSTCPEKTNMLAIFNLLGNFKVEDFVKERIEIDQMIRHSMNLIYHSHDNRISKKEMTEIFENINKFMESTKLSNGIKSKTKDRLKKVQLISGIGKWYVYKRVLPKQRTGFAVEQERTVEFLNITRSLQMVFETENKTAMELLHDNHLELIIGLIVGVAFGATWIILKSLSK